MERDLFGAAAQQDVLGGQAPRADEVRVTVTPDTNAVQLINHSMTPVPGGSVPLAVAFDVDLIGADGSILSSGTIGPLAGYGSAQLDVGLLAGALGTVRVRPTPPVAAGALYRFSIAAREQTLQNHAEGRYRDVDVSARHFDGAFHRVIPPIQRTKRACVYDLPVAASALSGTRSYVTITNVTGGPLEVPMRAFTPDLGTEYVLDTITVPALGRLDWSPDGILLREQPTDTIGPRVTRLRLDLTPIVGALVNARVESRGPAGDLRYVRPALVRDNSCGGPEVPSPRAADRSPAPRACDIAVRRRTRARMVHAPRLQRAGNPGVRVRVLVRS